MKTKKTSTIVENATVLDTRGKKGHKKIRTRLG